MWRSQPIVELTCETWSGSDPGLAVGHRREATTTAPVPRAMAANASKRSVGEDPVAGSAAGSVVTGAAVVGAAVVGATVVVVVVVVDVEAGTATFARG